MKITELFTKPLARPINGVVKVDQQDDAVIWQELDEYVITRELGSHFNHLFTNYLNAIDNRQDPAICNRIGVWVSGFFGSGKSHFIKILSYLLRNSEVKNPATGNSRRAGDFFDSKIKENPLLLADIKRAVNKNTDVILFNIDSKADNKEGRDAILSVFMRVFNEMQGFTGDAPHVAEIERQLTERNLFEQFQQEYKNSSGEDWLRSRDAHLLMRDEIVEALSKTLNKSRESAQEWFDKAEESYKLSIDRFARNVKEYLERKGPDHRIVFIADEVGQFIGSDTHLMLNLQTIAEDLGSMCGGRAWVIVTSQEDIDAVLGDVKAARANDFSKIQGRFYTRLSLSSTNTDEVIQIRLLEKTADAERELQDLFAQTGEILKHQLSFSDSSGQLKTYRDKDDFSKNYPFAPYHFQLVQKIFESIRKAGATGMHLSRGERSMLDAFQAATLVIAEQNIGALVPLYAFYPSIESFLDTTVKRTIQQASDNPNLTPFDIQLLRVLFLIRYVDIIKSNVENLVTLCIDTVDADRLTLKREIEESLQRLEKETLVNRNGTLYFFLTNEERDVSREIKNVDISSTDEVKKLAEFIYEDVLKGENKHKYQSNKRDYGFNRICDKYVFGSKVDQSLVMEFITPLFDEYPFFITARCVVYSSEEGGRVLIKLPDNAELGRELRIYLQTEKYIKHKTDTAAPDTLKRILGERKQENFDRSGRIGKLLDTLIQEADFFVYGQQLQIKASNNTRAAINEAQSYLIQNIYNKLNYIDYFHPDPQKEIISTLNIDTVGQQNLQLNIAEKNGQAVKEIRLFIELCSLKNKSILLNELITHFAGNSFGWPEWEIAIMVTRLFVAGEISLMLDGGPLKFNGAIEPLTKSSQWKLIKILKHKAVEAADLKSANKLCKELFNVYGPESEEGLYNFLTAELNKWRSTMNSFKPLADVNNYPGRAELDTGLELLRQLDIQDSYQFFEKLLKLKDSLHDLSDDINDQTGFYKTQRATWDKLRNSMDGIFKDNRQELEKDPEVQKALQKVEQILSAANPYGLLKESDSLLATINKFNDACIEVKRSFALAKTEEKIDHIKQELATIKADANLSNQLLLPLQTIKKDLEKERSIPKILYHQSQALETFNHANDITEEQRNRQQQQDGKPVKPTKVVHVAGLSQKVYLESADEVDQFLTTLKHELDEALKQNARIQIK